MSGWIKLHRQLTSHWIWENSDYLKWWLDILLEVNHTDQKSLIKGVLFECKRGEKLYSLDTWAKRWKTNKSKVRRFLELLQKEKMISLKNETLTTRLTVCKYDSYQDERNTGETQTKRKRNANETQTKPIQECNNDNNVKNEKEISFERFWDLYSKKVDLEKSKAKFIKLSDKDIDLILGVVEKYVLSTPDKKYRKNPLTWLNGKCWNDIIQDTKEKPKFSANFQHPDKTIAL
jgi:hypothetical protein